MALNYPLLYDWDVVHAVRLDVFDRLLAGRSKQQPARTVGLTKAETYSAPAELAWVFTSWRIVAAVGGRFSFALGFQAGALLFKDVTYDLTPLTCRIDADMALREKARRLEAAGVKPHAISLRSPLAPESWAGVMIEDPRTGETRYTDLIRALIKTALDKWFLTAEGAAAFDAQFADLSIVTGANADESAWPTPTAVGLAGAAQPDLAHRQAGIPTIGLLAMTATTDIGAASYTLSPYAIPDGAPAALLVSSRCFLDHIIGPALKHAFAPAAGSDAVPFTTSLQTGRMTNRFDLHFPLVTGDGQVHQASATAGTLECFVDGDELILSIQDMTFPVTVLGVPSATIHVSVHERFHLALLTVEGTGRKLLSFRPVAEARVTINEDKSLWTRLAPVVMEAAFVIVSHIVAGRLGVVEKLVGKGLSAVAARFVAGLIVAAAGLAGNLLGRLPDLLSHLEQESLAKMPDFVTVLAPALESVRWPTRVMHELTDARFADCVQFSLTIQSSPAAR